jgi:HEAT repeat protein
VAAGVKKQKETARAALLKALREDKKCDVREQCAGFLSKIAQDKEIVDALIERLLNDEWSKVRAMCVNSLQEIKDPSCLEALRQALDKDAYSTVRAPAAAALLAFKDREAEPLFIKGLKDGWSNVRLICARALGELGSQKAFQSLSESLNDKYAVVKAEAALSLGKIGDASVLPALEKAAKDEDPMVRESVYEAIAKIAKRHSELQKKAADFLADSGLGDKGFGPKLFAVRGLVRLEDKRGADEIVKILKSDRMFERIEGIQLAAEENVTDAGVMAALEKMAKSGKKDALDTKKAAEALEKLKKK